MMFYETTENTHNSAPAHLRRNYFVINMKIPVYSCDLIKHLDETFPHKCPTLKANWEEVQRYAGKRELIDALLRKLEKAEIENLKEVNIP